jgi:predicted negative regulator of RcsB-dependent stress response
LYTWNAAMTRHPTARRVHRDNSAPDDVFVAGVLESTAWAKRHQRSLIVGGIIVVVLAVAVVVYLTNRSAQREQAATELSQVRSVAFSGNTALAIRDLEVFVRQYGSTPSGDEARLLLARAYLDEGRHDDAVETVSRLARNVDSDLGANAAMLVAAAHESAGNHAAAEEAYLRLGDDGRFLFQRQEGLDHAARIRLQQGNAAGAVELYERILDMTPDDAAERQIYELRLGEARVLEANPSAIAPAQAPAGQGPAPSAPAAEPGATQPATEPPPTTTGG